MTVTLPELPYSRDALEPHISQQTLDYHYGKHHQTYVNKLNSLIAGTAHENQDLETILLNSEGGIFNNAAQVWNHTFYWQSMRPGGGGEPTGQLGSRIDQEFGSFADFKEKFTQAALTRFGSGWAWLIATKGGRLDVVSTANADNPMTDGNTPLLTCDVWEHAYYLDTQNDRPQYLENFWALVNWDFVEKNLTKVA